MGSYETLYALLTAEEAQSEKPELFGAIRAYAYGDYSTALQILLSAMPRHPCLQALTRAPANLETWLLAVSLVGNP